MIHRKIPFLNLTAKEIRNKKDALLQGIRQSHLPFVRLTAQSVTKKHLSTPGYSTANSERQ